MSNIEEIQQPNNNLVEQVESDNFNMRSYRFDFQKLMVYVENKYLKQSLPFLQVGDTVRCGLLIKEGNKERTQFYEGIIIAQKKQNKGIGWNFTVRRMMQGIGIERIFLVHSPKLVSLIVKSSAKVRRAKLYYLRALSGKASRLQQQFN